MGRNSKLTPDQWADVERRLLSGETPSSLAREYGIHPSQITRKGLAQKTQRVQSVAQQVAAAQSALAELPPAQQYQALSLAEKLRSISDNLAAAAMHGAATAHRLNALANAEVGKVDDAAPLESLEALRGVGALSKLANESASIALNLLAANKERVQALEGPSESLPTTIALVAPQ